MGRFRAILSPVSLNLSAQWFRGSWFLVHGPWPSGLWSVVCGSWFFELIVALATRVYVTNTKYLRARA